MPGLNLIGAAALTIATSLALAAERPASISSKKCDAAFAGHRLGGHEVRSHPEVLRVREVRGTVTSEGGPWPEGTPVIFQILGPAGRPVVRRTTVASNGAFGFDRPATGDYCFE